MASAWHANRFIGVRLEPGIVRDMTDGRELPLEAVVLERLGVTTHRLVARAVRLDE